MHWSEFQNSWMNTVDWVLTNHSLMQILITVPYFGCLVARPTWINSKNCKKEHLQLCMAITRLIMMIRIYLMRLVAIEIFKCSRGVNPLYLNDMFINKESNYNLRDQSRLLQPKFNTKRYGYRSFQYFGSKVWNSLPASIKALEDLGMFKQHLFNWCLTDHANRLMEQLEL